MPELTRSVTELINEFAKMPGIGRKSAERLAYYVLRLNRTEALALADAIRNVKENVRYCRNCYNLAEQEECEICRDPNRNHEVICVVEQPRDLMALEQAGVYRGLYHVLLGRIAPLEGIGPEQLTIDALVNRVRGGTCPGNRHGDQSDGRRRRDGPLHFEPVKRLSGASYPLGAWNYDRQYARIC